MKKFAALRSNKKGFTLIELLIVIALLGALAVGLLATIDPFEQLKKGRDTSQRNTVSEIYNSLLRYYSIKGYFPWNTATSTNATAGVGWTNFSSAITELISVGELKARFQDLAGTGNLNKIYIYSPTGESASVCFKPESKAFQAEANTVYDQSGLTSSGFGTSCKGAGGTSINCYFCVQ
jgi:prepilin-type N-terminal cleavage/methylation domain-containing protein